jgi:hypothetical protein
MATYPALVEIPAVICRAQRASRHAGAGPLARSRLRRACSEVVDVGAGAGSGRRGWEGLAGVVVDPAVGDGRAMWPRLEGRSALCSRQS